MTTIAYKNGTLASDTRATLSDMIVPGETEKIVQLEDGTLIGCAGEVDDFEPLFSSVEDGRNPPELDDVSAILIEPDGSVFIYEGKRWTPTEAPYYAIGSGAPYALAAMEMKASAKRAVAVAMKFDPYSGGDIRSLKLPPRKRKR